jgi:nuclear GTP-binding protein
MGKPEPKLKPLKGENFYKDAKAVKRANMLKDGGKPVRNAKGKIVKAAAFQGRLPSGTVSRVEPNKKWFGNTRTISQTQLEKFKEAVKEKINNPYDVLLYRHKLPLSLLTESSKMSRMHLLDTEKFQETFGPKSSRKRPRLSVASLEDMANHVESTLGKFLDFNFFLRKIRCHH